MDQTNSISIQQTKAEREHENGMEQYHPKRDQYKDRGRRKWAIQGKGEECRAGREHVRWRWTR